MYVDSYCEKLMVFWGLVTIIPVFAPIFQRKNGESLVKYLE